MLNSYNLYIDKLNPDYKESFKKINDYVHANKADEIKNEEILSEVMDSFLEAQSTGKSVDQVTGDLESFCVELCSEIGIRSRIISLLEMFHPMFIVISVFCILDLIDMISSLPDIEEFNFFTYRGMDSSLGYLIGGLIVFVAHYISKVIIKKYVFSNPKKYKVISTAVAIASFVILVGAIAYLYSDSHKDANTGTFLWINILCCAVFWIVYRVLTRESRKYRKENKISIEEAYESKEKFLEDIEKTEMKIMDRINARRVRKGEAPMSLKEFLDYEKKEINKWYNQPLFHILLVVGITGIATVFTYVIGGFESTADLCIFVIILLALESPIMYFMYKVPRWWNKNYLQKWIDSKETESD